MFAWAMLCITFYVSVFKKKMLDFDVSQTTTGDSFMNNCSAFVVCCCVVTNIC